MGGELCNLKVTDVAAPTRNALVGGPFGSNLVSRDYVDTGVPVIRGQNMGERWISGEFAFVSEEKAESLASNLAHPGDIIFTQRGTLGQVSMVPPEPYQKYLVSQSQMKLTVNTEMADPLFLYYVFCSPGQQEYIRQNTTQSGVPHTNLGTLRETPIALPRLREQRAIADILGTLDDKIEFNRQMNRTLEGMVRAIFKGWFVDFEPVKAKVAGSTSFLGMPQLVFDQLPDRFTDTELGTVPEGWEVVPLSDLVELIGGGTPKRKEAEYWGGDIPWFSVRDAPNDGDVWVIDTQEKISQSGVDNSSARVMDAGTSIISARGTVGRLAMAAVPMSMNQSCYGVTGKEGVGDFFVYFTLNHAVVELQQRTHGSVFDTITRKTFDGLRCARPQPEMLEAFEEMVGAYLLKMRGNLLESEVLAALRDTLLPKLISGEVRVSDAEGGGDAD